MSDKKYTSFSSELKVRPDDIDMNRHVHSSRYMDYVMTARYDHMENGYKMSMEQFLKHNYGWVINSVSMEFKRPLFLGDTVTITTWVEEVLRKGVRVGFEIVRNKTKKVSCSGCFNYTMVNTETGTSEVIPDWIVKHYSI